MKLSVTSIVLAGYFFCPHVASADSFTFVSVDLPGGGGTIYGINDAGQIVGTANDGSGQIGFLQTNGVFTIIDAPRIPTGDPVKYTIAWDINNAGQIVGSSLAGQFLYANGVFTFISLPGDATGINDLGQLVGSFTENVGTTSFTHGFLDANGVLTTIDFPGANQRSTHAHGINNAGQIVGFFADSSGVHGFLDTNGAFTPIDVPGTFITQAYGINDAGQIVGSAGNTCPGTHAFLYSNGVFTTFDFPGATCTAAFAINNAGQVGGVYLDSIGGLQGFVATPVPEPGSFACPLGQGFWKNHSGAWPVTSLTLGSQTYTQTQLLTILTTPVKGDASLILADQLIAAKLNIAHGSNPAPVSASITDADSLLSQFGSNRLPYSVGTSSAIGQQMVNDANVFDRYNNRDLTPACQP